jgi:hypothetical protein
MFRNPNTVLGKVFISFPKVQTGSGAHISHLPPPNEYWLYFLGLKRPEFEVDHSPPST